ncbi:MAG: aldo/keto reductase [Gammaproteobacteria bacterium]|nr:aldo/keto reductase [Gammaproteobacteria bacterium]MDH3464540.1 aldo/keto reductase [Gammaproteobacteria bacterium]
MKRQIGKSGRWVFAVGLGGMPLSIRSRPDRHHAAAVIEAAVESGVDFIDTADSYCIDDNDIGHNERLISETLRQLDTTDRVLLATKGGLTRPDGRWERCGSPEHLRAACERSLVALGTESIALYQFHAPDTTVPFADSIGALADLRAQGKIQNVGLSNVTRNHIDDALTQVPIVSVQNRCHVLCQDDIRSGLLDYCATKGITFIPYSPVGGGNGHKTLRDVAVLREIGHGHQCSPYRVALAWLLSKGNHVLPIPGASRIESITDSARAVDVTLSSQEILQIDRLAD